MTVSGFDAWAATYEGSALQRLLFDPAQRCVLERARRLVPRPRRVLDIGCGTGRLLRQARRHHPAAMLVGVDASWRMVATATADTPAELAIGHLRAAAERLPFAAGVFDLVVATMSVRHWTDVAAATAEVGRVLCLGGVLVVADVVADPGLAGMLAAREAAGLVSLAHDRAPSFRHSAVQVVAMRKPPAS
jgi:ubiquinone/menaquinone biosynthesis C-methylase UbiE